MNINQARTIAEMLHAGKPHYKEPAYTLWIQTVSTFLRFVEEANDTIDIERLENICEGEP